MTGIDVIIVNWNAGRQLLDCLESLVNANGDGIELKRVVVVDNASSDGSADELDGLSLPLTVIRNDTNRGFAAACNQGAKDSGADYLLFLNPDTRLFKDSLVKPLAFMEQQINRIVGITGIQLLDEKGRVSRTCARFPTLSRLCAHIIGLDRLYPRLFLSHFMREWDHGHTMDVDQIMGAFFLTRRAIFEFLGGFDERFFVYLEDVDFSKRAYQNGWRTVYLVEAQAFHKGGGISEQVKATRLFYFLRSRILYGYKHFGWLPATLLLAGTLFPEFFIRLIHAACKRSGRDVLEIISAYCRLWVSMPALILNQDGKQTP